MTEQLTTWFASLFSDNVSHEIIIFLTSLFPILECRGGMILAKLFEINFFKAFAICYVGNMIPMPFILLFIKEIFKFMKKHKYKKESDWIETFEAVCHRYNQAELDARKKYGLFYKLMFENKIRKKSRQ